MRNTFLLLVVMLVGTGCQTMMAKIHALPDVPCPVEVDPTPGAMCKKIEIAVPGAGNFLSNLNIAQQYVDIYRGPEYEAQKEALKKRFRGASQENKEVNQENKVVSEKSTKEASPIGTSNALKYLMSDAEIEKEYRDEQRKISDNADYYGPQTLKKCDD